MDIIYQAENNLKCEEKSNESNLDEKINNNNEQKEKEKPTIEYENYLNNAKIFTLLALIGCKILTENQEKEMMSKIGSNLINERFLSKDDFYSINFWFESEFEAINNFNKTKFKRVSIFKAKTSLKKSERKLVKQMPFSPSKSEKINKNTEDISPISIKDFLFNIWKDDKGTNFNLKDFINAIKPEKYIKNLEEIDYDEERYFDIIFSE